jgi:hypothetical protein
VKRADKNHWGPVVVLIVLGNIAPFVLFLKSSTPVAVVGTLLISIGLFFAAHSLLCSRRWWVAPLVGSPLVVGPFLLGTAFVLVIAGVLPVP